MPRKHIVVTVVLAAAILYVIYMAYQTWRAPVCEHPETVFGVTSIQHGEPQYGFAKVCLEATR
jgi:hypothetical protein